MSGIVIAAHVVLGLFALAILAVVVLGIIRDEDFRRMVVGVLVLVLFASSFLVVVWHWQGCDARPAEAAEVRP